MRYIPWDFGIYTSIQMVTVVGGGNYGISHHLPATIPAVYRNCSHLSATRPC